jgi:hypothetical protein
MKRYLRAGLEREEKLVTVRLELRALRADNAA